MKDSDNFNEKLFLKAFNIGYTLSQDEPKIYETLIDATNDISGDYVDGLRDGGMQQKRDNAYWILKDRQDQSADHSNEYDLDR